VFTIPTQKTHPSPDDSLAQIDNPLRYEMIMYRTFIFVFTVFEYDYSGIFWLKYAIMFISSVLFVYQYFKYLPYYDESISFLYGYLNVVQLWIMITSLIALFTDVNGHLIIILIGLMPIYIMVKYIRGKRFDSIFFKQPEDSANEFEALIQCNAVSKVNNTSFKQELQLAGLVTLHLRECKSKTCPLHSLKQLYDPCINTFASDLDNIHPYRNNIFLKHFAKYYFDTALNKYNNNPKIKIAYAFFMFNSFRNIQSALTEIRQAKNYSLSMTQNFEIHKFE
jgi:hypothetical protein